MSRSVILYMFRCYPWTTSCVGRQLCVSNARDSMGGWWLSTVDVVAALRRGTVQHHLPGMSSMIVAAGVVSSVNRRRFVRLACELLAFGLAAKEGREPHITRLQVA